jgi:DNA-binding winged helix-turn-helix (wHTH) protein
MVGYGIEASDLDISFGRFRLLPARRLLLDGDKPVRIGSRALDLLIALAERPCELISKAELISKVWPDTFVGETNLRVHIRSLRRTLGDGQAGNRYISNATGRGYSFVAPVSASARPRGLTVPQAVTEPLSTVTSPLRSSIGRDELIGKVLAQLPDQGLSTFVGHGGSNMRMLLVLDNCEHIIEALNLACKIAGARQRRKQDAFKKLKRHVANVA